MDEYVDKIGCIKAKDFKHKDVDDVKVRQSVQIEEF